MRAANRQTGGAASKSTSRGRNRHSNESNISTAPSDVYQELLDEAISTVPGVGLEGPAIKKRRVESTSTVEPNLRHDFRDEALQNPNGPLAFSAETQTIYDASASSDDSDVDWEEVELEEDGPKDRHPDAADLAVEKDISVSLDADADSKRQTRKAKRPLSSVLEKKKRLEIHKIHLCCLLFHVYIRNSWCNDANVQTILKPLLTSRTVSYLNPESSLSQFQRSRSFADGLQQASDAFRGAYKITRHGLRRAEWREHSPLTEKVNLNDEAENIAGRAGFSHHAEKREGSRDCGAQLFCALLRSVGVNARLVCSLQPLSFVTTTTPSKSNATKPTLVYNCSEDDELLERERTAGDSLADLQTEEYAESSNTIRPIKRFGTPSAPAIDLGKAPRTPVRQKPIKESSFPVYWVEAFNLALQKWLPVDPLVTRTIAKAHKFEPPTTDSSNDMSYVVAFEEDGTAKDVTRRYAKAYNAKTRRTRIDATKDGWRWWRKALKVFDNGLEAKDRDQVEAAELAQKEASEPIPRNVQDFKDHPQYALERHLKRHQVVFPKHQVGKLNTSKGLDNVEAIYRRNDVKTVKSADRWYREGHEIKPGEQPLKFVTASRRQRQRSITPNSGTDRNDGDQSIGLYADFQTQTYIPPPVVSGRVPKNVFGNLDVYATSMIPPAGVHVRAIEARKAAQIIGVDYADAVTGFEFKGRQGTAVINGVVVAKEYAEAMAEVIKCLREELEIIGAEKRSRQASALWKRFLIGLRIQERVMEYAEEEEKDRATLRERIDDVEDEEERLARRGGFLPAKDPQNLNASSEDSQERRDSLIADATASGLGSKKIVQTKDKFGHSRTTESYSFQSPQMIIFSPWDSANSPTTVGIDQRAAETTSGTVGAFYTSSSIKDMQDVALERGLLTEATNMDNAFVASRVGNGTFAEDGGFINEENQGNDKDIFVVKDVTDSRVAEEQSRADLEEAGRIWPTEQSIDSLAPEIRGRSPPPSFTSTHKPARHIGVDTMVEEADIMQKISVVGEDDLSSPKKQDTSDLEDQTSLLSHDPEDDDMEPDWLAEDVHL